MAKLKLISLNGKKGYKSSDGTIIIEPQFDDGVGYFGIDSYNHSEYAPVSLNGKCGMINESGTIIIPFEYQEVCHLFDDFFAVRKELPEKKWSYGVIKPDGTVIVPFEYKMITKVGHFFECFKEAISSRIYTHTLFDTRGSVFKYSQEKDPVVYNSNGEMIYEGPAINSKYEYLVVNKNDKYGIIDQDGKHIIEIEYEDVIIASPNRFIIRRNDGDSWLFGVEDSKTNIIIDFSYKYITSVKGAFFDCFRESNSTLLEDSHHYGERYEYFNKEKEFWFNSIGEEVYQGEAEVLSEELLVCNKDGKKAVFNHKGKKIVNFLYDSIHLLDNSLIVEKDSKIGLLTVSGNVVIDALYTDIEFVHIDDSVSTRYNSYRDRDEEVYGSYSKKTPFDTSANEDHLNRQIIQRVKGGMFGHTYISCPQRNHYSFNDIMILRTESYAELFSIEEGIVHNSRFDTIKQLTDLSFVVSKDGKYGVYRRDVHRLIIGCEYERIIFEGGHVVLLFRDGLWGAKTLVLPEHPLYQISKADVPVQFKEISILNSEENLFGVKHCRTNYNEEVIEEYTMVDEVGNVYKEMNRFSDLSTMPILYDLNHILTSRDDKYGFVSVNGYESIPFIYDEIHERGDSMFDVRIEASWGVIDLLGKVVVPVKYSNPIPSIIDNAIVSETISGRLGVLGKDGKEKIPTVYEHLMMKDRIIYCGYGGYESDYKYSNHNFFSEDIEFANWGVLTKDGVLIIDPIYDCFKEQDGYILAGRDGNFLGEGQHGYSFHQSEYGGVYDLFDYEGNIILGGFNKFYRDKEQNLLYFHFGGGWKQECENYDEDGNAIFYHSYHWKEGNGRWLVTDMNLTSIIPNQDGSTFTFRKGAKCTITRKEENGTITNYWSFPLEQLSVLKPVLIMGCFIVGDNNRQRVIRLNDRATSRFYHKLEVIDRDKHFTYERKESLSGVGIASFEQELISCNKCYLLLTEPVLDFVFAVQEIDNDNYSVLLLNTQNAEHIITAIDKVDYSVLVELLSKGKLQLLANKYSHEYNNLSVRDKSIFNEGFISAINIKEQNEPYDENAQYWFSVDIVVSRESDDDNDDYYSDRGDDGWDYKRETWDAMTDGMYGDMPDGFDGDYDFLG